MADCPPRYATGDNDSIEITNPMISIMTDTIVIVPVLPDVYRLPILKMTAVKPEL